MADMIVQGASAIELDVGGRLKTPYGWRRAIDKGSYEVYFLDYPDWRELVDDAVIVRRYSNAKDAESHSLRLEHEYVVRRILLAALDPENRAAVEAAARVLHGDLWEHSVPSVVAVVSALRAVVEALPASAGADVKDDEVGRG